MMIRLHRHGLREMPSRNLRFACWSSGCRDVRKTCVTRLPGYSMDGFLATAKESNLRVGNSTLLARARVGARSSLDSTLVLPSRHGEWASESNLFTAVLQPAHLLREPPTPLCYYLCNVA